jgi:hypothetical protein
MVDDRTGDAWLPGAVVRAGDRARIEVTARPAQERGMRFCSAATSTRAATLWSRSTASRGRLRQNGVP